MVQVTSTIDIAAESLNAAVLTNLELTRADHVQDSNVEFPVKLTDGRVFDSGAVLPTTAASDDLGIGAGAAGTQGLYLTTSDAKATTVTQKALFEIDVPYEFDAGKTFQIVVNGEMDTTISDGTATVDLNVYKVAAAGTHSADLCATVAQNINSLTAADVTFSITSGSLNPGDKLHVYVTIAITDSSTVTAVYGRVNSIRRKLDCRG